MTRRSYGEQCGVARFLDLLGERWTLLVMRNLVMGPRGGQPRSFTNLHETLPGISRNMLTSRLAYLEREGLVRRAGPKRSAGWEATEEGMTLLPVLQAIFAWGWEHTEDPTAPAGTGARTARTTRTKGAADA